MGSVGGSRPTAFIICYEKLINTFETNMGSINQLYGEPPRSLANAKDGVGTPPIVASPHFNFC